MLGWAPGTGGVGSGTHPFNLEVNGNDWIARVQYDSIVIECPGPGTNGSMTFDLWDSDSTATILEWDEVRFIEHGAARPILFGGFVQAVATTPWAGSTGRYLKVTCVGYGILLDKKIVVAYDPFGNPDGPGTDDGIGQWVQALLGQYGGRVYGMAYRPGASTTYSGDETKTIFIHSDWIDGTFLPALASTTLRQGLEQWAGTGMDITIGGTQPGIGWVYWVDAYARMHAFWDKTTVDTGYEGTITLTETTANETYGDLTYEREHTDKATSAYVIGGNASGTGMVRRTAHERAGDLEEVVEIGVSTSTALRDFYGDNFLSSAAGDPVRGSFSMTRNTPIDVRPGQKLVATSTPLGYSGTTLGRITGVSIAFQTYQVRTYEVSFGGRWNVPSAANRAGRFATRGIG